MIPTLFVTATGTDVGKTFVACALLRELNRRRISIEPFKPVLSGFTDPESSDAGRLLRAAGRSLMDLAKVSPLRFRAALAPPSAARGPVRTPSAPAPAPAPSAPVPSSWEPGGSRASGVSGASGAPGVSRAARASRGTEARSSR